MNQQWAIEKATNLSQAWHLQFGSWPTLHGIILGLSQCTAENDCGDAWPGPDGKLHTADDTNNWGSDILRKLNATELAVLAAHGITPTVGPDHEARARAAQLALEHSGLPLPAGEIHCDSAPGVGAYFIWFAAFRDYRVGDLVVPGAVLGARYYLRITCGYPGHLKWLFNLFTSEWSTVDQYARIAYKQRYFTGTSPDPETDIQRYIQFMGPFVPRFTQLLADFDPTKLTPVPPPPPRLPLSQGMTGIDVRECQLAMGADPDGDWGPKTTQVCARWRAAHGLAVPPSVWDEQCENIHLGLPPNDEPVQPRIVIPWDHPDWQAMQDERNAAWDAAQEPS